MKASALYVTSTVAWDLLLCSQAPGNMLITDVLLESALLRVGQRYPLVSPRAAENTYRMPARMKAILDDWITDCGLDYRLRFSEARPEAANSRRRMAASTYCRIRMCAVACGFLVNCWERMTQLSR
jgi:hypothetical protein